MFYLGVYTTARGLIPNTINIAVKRSIIWQSKKGLPKALMLWVRPHQPKMQGYDQFAIP